jgi:hypothetical protein
MNYEGFGLNWTWPNPGSSPAFTGDTEEAHENLKHFDVAAEIRTEGLPNRRLQRYFYPNQPSRYV